MEVNEFKKQRHEHTRANIRAAAVPFLTDPEPWSLFAIYVDEDPDTAHCLCIQGGACRVLTWGDAWAQIQLIGAELKHDDWFGMRAEVLKQVKRAECTCGIYPVMPVLVLRDCGCLAFDMEVLDPALHVSWTLEQLYHDLFGGAEDADESGR